MKERPILFSAPMVRALLNCTKSQTRRVVKWPLMSASDGGKRRIFTERDSEEINGYLAERQRFPLRKGFCPYGQPGDRIYVREAFRLLDTFDADSPSDVGELCLSAGYPKPWAPIQYEADASRDNWIHVGTPPHDDGPPEAGKIRPGSTCPAGPAASCWRSSASASSGCRTSARRMRLRRASVVT